MENLPRQIQNRLFSHQPSGDMTLHRRLIRRCFNAKCPFGTLDYSILGPMNSCAIKELSTMNGQKKTKRAVGR